MQTPTMTYENLKASISYGIEVPDYYQQLLSNAESIILDTGMNSQAKVAKELGLSQTKLSHIKDILVAYIKMQTEEANNETN